MKTATKIEVPKNLNYAATIVSVDNLIDLPGLDNLVGVPTLGHQALTQKDVMRGELRVAFTSETQLSEDYCAVNSLYREAELNKDPDEKGYLEKNRRIRALKLRGHVSNALLMPLSSLEYTGVDLADLNEGVTFDTLNGHDICCKYVIPQKPNTSQSRNRVERAFRRVDTKLFPEHLETDNYWRNKHLLDAGHQVVITQKLHGTSWRGGNVPCARKKNVFERFLNRFFSTPTYEYDVVFGSRKVIKDPKNPNQNHYYANDIWTEYGKQIASVIPQGYIVYGELIGWTPDGKALQKNYTYHLPEGEAELYVYRVANINLQGVLTDLSWDGLKQFCQARGLKWVPELFRALPGKDLDFEIEGLLDEQLASGSAFEEAPLILSHHFTVDEGICVRQEGLVPLILKAKSPVFLEHETKLLDKGEVDIESAS